MENPSSQAGPPDPPPALSARHQAVQAEVQIGTTTIRYLRAGAGPPVVFFRREPAASQLWYRLVTELISQIRVVVPDPPATAETIPFTSWAEAFFDGIGLASAAIVSDWSRIGDTVAFAGANPDRVDRIVVLAPETQSDLGLDLASASMPVTDRFPLLVVPDASPTAFDRIARFLTEPRRR